MITQDENPHEMIKCGSLLSPLKFCTSQRCSKQQRRKEGCQRPVRSWRDVFATGPFSRPVIISLPSAVVLEWKPSPHSGCMWGGCSLERWLSLTEQTQGTVSGLSLWRGPVALATGGHLSWGLCSCRESSCQFPYTFKIVYHISKPLSNLTQIHH